MGITNWSDERIIIFSIGAFLLLIGFILIAFPNKWNTIVVRTIIRIIGVVLMLTAGTMSGKKDKAPKNPLS